MVYNRSRRLERFERTRLRFPQGARLNRPGILGDSFVGLAEEVMARPNRHYGGSASVLFGPSRSQWSTGIIGASLSDPHERGQGLHQVGGDAT